MWTWRIIVVGFGKGLDNLQDLFSTQRRGDFLPVKGYNLNHNSLNGPLVCYCT